MAKVKFTDNGNIKVTMTPYQWEILSTICNGVRLGNRNSATSAISDLLIDVEPFNLDHRFGEDGRVKATVTINDCEREYDDYAIELECCDHVEYD